MIQRLVNRQAAFQSASHGPIIEPLNAAYFLERKLPAAPFYELRDTAVKTLLVTRSPAAILGAVVPVAVDAVNAEVGWGLPHISDKVIETLPPARAYVDPSRSIVLPSTRGRKSAARDHASVDAICPVRRDVFGIRVAACRKPLTSFASTAAGGSTAPQVDQPYFRYAATAAAALNEPDASRSVGSPYRRKFAKHRPSAKRGTNFNRLRVWARHKVHHNIVESGVKKGGVTVLKGPAK